MQKYNLQDDNQIHKIKVDSLFPLSQSIPSFRSYQELASQCLFYRHSDLLTFDVGDMGVTSVVMLRV